jgi:hypothetical protein
MIADSSRYAVYGMERIYPETNPTRDERDKYAAAVRACEEEAIQWKKR